LARLSLKESSINGTVVANATCDHELAMWRSSV